MGSGALHDCSYYLAQIADLQVDMARADKVIQDQRRALDLLVDQLSTLKQQYSALKQQHLALEGQHSTLSQQHALVLEELRSMQSVHWFKKLWNR